MSLTPIPYTRTPDWERLVATAINQMIAADGNAGTYQPEDADLTAIAALATQSYGRGLLELADATAARAALQIADAAEVATSESTSSTSYVNLTTTGPSVTLTTGTSAIVFFGANVNINSTAQTAFISVAVSGATTLAASDSNAIQQSGSVANRNFAPFTVLKLTGLTAGSNTFTLKYRVDGGTWNFVRRRIAVIAL